MDGKRIPFTREDEERIASAGLWGIIAAVASVGSTALGAVATLLHPTPGDLLRQLITLTLNVVLGLWLYQACQAFREMARTDEADEHYLLLGFSKLRAYFMMTGIILIIALSIAVLAFLGALTCGAMYRHRF